MKSIKGDAGLCRLEPTNASRAVDCWLFRDKLSCLVNLFARGIMGKKEQKRSCSADTRLNTYQHLHAYVSFWIRSCRCLFVSRLLYTMYILHRRCPRGCSKSQQVRKNVLGCGAPTDIFLCFRDSDLNGTIEWRETAE